MRMESDRKPEGRFSIVRVGDRFADITFYVNVTSVPHVDEDHLESSRSDNFRETWVWDSYVCRARWREGLGASVEAHYEAWLAEARKQSYAAEAERVRARRDALLEASDRQMCVDRFGLSAPEGDSFGDWLPFLRGASERMTGPWAVYRQALRDLPDQPGFPFEVEFPAEPEDTGH